MALQIEFPPVRSGLHAGHADTEHHLYRLPNGYGLSAVRTPETQGGDRGRREAAVIRFDGPAVDDFDLVEAADARDVCGDLDDEQVAGLLARVARRPRVEVRL